MQEGDYPMGDLKEGTGNSLKRSLRRHRETPSDNPEHIESPQRSPRDTNTSQRRSMASDTSSQRQSTTGNGRRDERNARESLDSIGSTRRTPRGQNRPSVMTSRRSRMKREALAVPPSPATVASSQHVWASPGSVASSIRRQNNDTPRSRISINDDGNNWDGKGTLKSVHSSSPPYVPDKYAHVGEAQDLLTPSASPSHHSKPSIQEEQNSHNSTPTPQPHASNNKDESNCNQSVSASEASPFASSLASSPTSFSRSDNSDFRGSSIANSSLDEPVELPRPRPSAKPHKPRPVSHRKHHSKPPPPPPAPRRRQRGPDGKAAPAMQKGSAASQSNTKLKGGVTSSKSFLGSSLFNMSFLLAKPHANASRSDEKPGTEEIRKPSSLQLSALSTHRYPTNESSLSRLASYSALPSFSVSAAAANSNLHPAAAGSFRFSPRAPQNPPRRGFNRAEGRDFSTFYRLPSRDTTSSFIMSASESLDDDEAFLLDCGPSIEEPILSYRQAMRVAAFNHPGVVDKDGVTLIPHPLNSDFGWFDFPFKRLFYAERHTTSVLEKYGIGITLWFKFLKAFSIIFFVMFLVTVTSVIFFVNGNYYGSEETSFRMESSPTDLLFTTTLGNLGSTGTLCFSVPAGQEVAVDCQGGTVQAISAYYGQPSGSCTCPSIQQPLSSGTCPGDVVSKSGSKTCSMDLYGNKEACFLSELDLNYGSPQPCCAFNRDDKGEPDLSDLTISANYSCNSLTAQYIAEGMCLGKRSCMMIADPDYEYSWKGSLAKDLPSNVCQSRSFNSKVLMENQCNTTLGYTGSWESCPTGSPASSSRFLQIQVLCTDETIDILNTSVSKPFVVTLASALNALAVLIFIFGIYWVSYQQRMEEVYMDRNTCRAKDFTVRLDVIPDHSSTHELAKKLRRHFEKTLSASRPCYLPGIVRVADIIFTTGSFTVLEAAIKRGKAARMLDLLLYRKSVLEYLHRESGITYSLLTWRENSWKESYEYWNNVCVKLSLDGSNAKKVKRAYITFESEEGFLRCLKYFPSNTFSTYFRREDATVDGKVLHVYPAEDPSDILWENLGTPKIQQFLRRSLTTFLLVALLVATYFIVDKAIRSGDKFESEFPDVIDCDDYEVDLNRANVNSSIESLITYERTLRDVNWQYYNNSNGRQGFLQCYCREVYEENGLHSLMKYTFLNREKNQEEKWCRDIVLGFINLTVIRLVVAIVVVSVNISAKSILRALKDFERRSSHSEISQSMTAKLFVVQVVNTGLLVILMNGRSPVFEDSKITFLNGNYGDFTVEWYEDVGKSLMGTMALYMLGVHGLKFAMLVVNKWLRWQDKHFTSDIRLTYQVSQDQLNKLYLGPEFVIEVRYATALTICFVCVAYAPAMPMMYLIASAAFFILYCVDKYFFLRVYRIPRAVSPSLAHAVTRSLYFAAFLNLGVAIWSFSSLLVFNPEVPVSRTTVTYDTLNFVTVSFRFDQYNTFQERVFNKYTVASWVALLPLVLLIIMTLLVSLMRNFSPIARIFSSFSSFLHVERPYEGNPEYFDSLPLPLLKRRVEDGIGKRHILQRYRERIKEYENTPSDDKQLEGLESYDIGMNEIYADKIALNSDYILRNRPPDLFQHYDPNASNDRIHVVNALNSSDPQEKEKDSARNDEFYNGQRHDDSSVTPSKQDLRSTSSSKKSKGKVKTMGRRDKKNGTLTSTRRNREKTSESSCNLVTKVSNVSDLFQDDGQYL
mmetsp:Transcript_24493/g.36018  ORF Transcript_24493/g.36018 Transcript_24493/m.36018 type:complete len:1721 (-) Transcript_24493:92-5254(-)